MGKQISKNFAESKGNQANKLYLKGDYEEAIALYSCAIWLVPNQIEYYDNRIGCYMMVKDYKKALTNLNHTLKLNHKHEKSYFRMIKCCLTLGDISGTEYAINCYKNLTENSINKNTISTTQYEQKVLKLKDLLISIQTNFYTKNYDNCLNDVKKSLLISPDWLFLKYQKVELLILLNKFIEARAIIGKTLYKLEQNSIDLLYLSILYSYHIGDLSKCVLDCERNFKLIKKHNHMKINLLYNEAKIIYDKNNIANNLLRNEKYSEAIFVYSTAIEYHTLSHSIQTKLYFDRASVYFKMNLYTEAINDCEKALNISPKHLQTLYLSAKCHFELNLYQKCMELCETGLPEEKLTDLWKKAKLQICGRKKENGSGQEKRSAEEEGKTEERKGSEDIMKELERNIKEEEKRKGEQNKKKENEIQINNTRKDHGGKCQQDNAKKQEVRNGQNYKTVGKYQWKDKRQDGNQQNVHGQRQQENRGNKSEKMQSDTGWSDERQQKDKKQQRQRNRRGPKNRRRQKKRNEKRHESEKQQKQEDEQKQEEENQSKREQLAPRQAQRYQFSRSFVNSNNKSFDKEGERYYKILNLNTNATKEDIEFAFKSLANKHNPDKHPNSPMKELNQEIFKRIKEAYSILSDRFRKSEYQVL